MNTGNLSPHDITIIVDKSVRTTLTTLGIDLSSTEELRQVQADFSYMRRQRLGADEIGKWARKSILTAAIGGVMYALWAGLMLISKGGH